MAKFKYIIIKKTGLELPRIGTVLEDHFDLKSPNDKVIAGGFLQIFETIDSGLEFKCYGRSISCNVESRQEVDADIIKRAYEF